MELIKVEVSCPKEIYDIVNLVSELVKDIKDKKGFELIAAENFPLLIKAIDGVDKMPAEFKNKEALNAAFLLSNNIISLFLK